MNIGIDARLYGLEHAGIGRYVKNIVDRVIRKDTKNHYTLFLSPAYFNQINTPPNASKVLSTTQHYSLSEQIIVPTLYKKANLSLLHVPHFNVPLRYKAPFIVTIHDILWHTNKGSAVTTLSPLIYTLKYFGYKKTVAHSVHHAKAIIVPSRYVKKQLETFYPLANLTSKAKVIYEGVDQSLHVSDSSSNVPPATQEFINVSDYVVYVGSSYPHKNLKTLLSALKTANTNRTTPIKLVLVSARSIFLKQVVSHIATLKLEKIVHIAGFLPDLALSSVISNSRALIQPSLSEGFGLPGLEAMALGTPVIAANAGALPEVYGSSALYFEPLDQVSLAQNMQTIIDDPSLAKSLIAKGYQQVKNYSWDTAAQQTLSVYHQVLKKL